MSKGSTLNIVEGSGSPAIWHMDGVTQESVGTALHAEETVLRTTTHKLPNVPLAGASELSSEQVWSNEDAETSEHPCLAYYNTGNVRVDDHGDRAPQQIFSSACLPDRHCATEELQHADFSAFQVDTAGELMFGFQDGSTSEDKEFNLHQPPDHGRHATPMRYTSMRCTPTRYMPMRYIPMRYTHEVYAHEVHTHEVHAYEVHAHEV
jgi:hypothetical protein